MPKLKEFTKFNPKISNFFDDLEKNNNKEWFDENRSFYENEIREPLKSFVAKMAELFYENGLPYIADPKFSIFRINRDIRFSKNKDPYKTNLGAFFPFTLSQTVESKPSSIGLYLHYERNGCFIAGGMHIPSPHNLKLIRTRLLEDWKEFETLLNGKKFKSEFELSSMTEPLTTVPRGFPKDHPADKYLKMKEFTVWQNIPEKTFYDKNLPEIMLKKGELLEPYAKFLLEALES